MYNVLLYAILYGVVYERKRNEKEKEEKEREDGQSPLNKLPGIGPDSISHPWMISYKLEDANVVAVNSTKLMWSLTIWK
jgi:hypothetical protein